MFHIDKLPFLERDRVIEADKRQYEAWLHRSDNQSENAQTNGG